MPPHVAVVPAHTPFGLQNMVGGVRPLSTVPSQLSSRPLQISVPLKLHAYSQPSDVIPFRFTKPVLHDAITQPPALHVDVACASEQTRPHMPQLRESVIRLNPLSTVPSQSLSIVSQISSVGPVAPTHWSAPPRHVCAPGRQVPVDEPHAAPPPGL